MLVLIFIISLVNLGLGYWLAIYLGGVAPATAAVSIENVGTAEVDPSSEKIEEFLNEAPLNEAPREEPSAAATPTAVAEASAPLQTASQAEQVEYGPAERSVAAAAAVEPASEPTSQAEPAGDDQSETDVLEAIESFREQLSEAAEGFSNKEALSENDKKAIAAEQVEPIADHNTDGDSASEAENALLPESNRVDNVDADVMAGIDAFRSQLAAMKAG